MSNKVYKYCGSKIVIVGPDPMMALGAVQHLRNAMSANSKYFNGKHVLGWDVEWQVDVTSFGTVRGAENTQPTATGLVVGVGKTAAGVIVLHSALRGAGEEAMPPAIKALLVDPTVLKVGFNAGNDKANYRKYFAFEPTPLVDARVDFNKTGIKTFSNKTGLADIVATLFRKKMAKDQVTYSFKNDVTVLTPMQVNYLSADAQAHIHIHATLEARRQAEAQAQAAQDRDDTERDQDQDVTAASAGDGALVAPGLLDLSLDEGEYDDDEVLVIRPSPFQLDLFHLVQEIGIGFGTSNKWSPLFLKMVAETLKFIDPNCRLEIKHYLTRRAKKNALSITDAAAEVQASKEIHAYCIKNPRFVAWGTIPGEELYITLTMIVDLCKDLVCDKRSHKRPLFSKRGISVWQKLLAYVLDGFVSPPVGFGRSIPLQRCPVTGLVEYHTLCGTSGLEALHNVQRDAASHGMSDLCGDANLHSAMERTNVQKGVKNRGLPGYGHGKIFCYRREDLGRIKFHRADNPAFFNDINPFPHYNPKRKGEDNGERFGVAWHDKSAYVEAGEVDPTEAEWDRAKALSAIDTDSAVTQDDVEALVGLTTNKTISQFYVDIVSEVLDATDCGPRELALIYTLAELVLEVVSQAQDSDGDSQADSDAASAAATPGFAMTEAQLREKIAAWTGAAVPDIGLNAETTVGPNGLDLAQYKYGAMVEGTMAPLDRCYVTGQNVRKQINELHGVDVAYNTDGLYKAGGMERMLKIWKDLRISGGPDRTITPADVRREWNEQVQADADAAYDQGGEAAATTARAAGGLLLEKDARVFVDQVAVREQTLGLIAQINPGLRKIFIRQKELRAKPALIVQPVTAIAPPPRIDNAPIGGFAAPARRAVDPTLNGTRVPVDAIRTCWFCYLHTTNGVWTYSNSEMTKCLRRERVGTTWTGINNHTKQKGGSYSCPNVPAPTNEQLKMASTERDRHSKKKSRTRMPSASLFRLDEPAAAAEAQPQFTPPAGFEPVDAEEKYCIPICTDPGGDMVGCDNDDCVTGGGWFHLQCVGLATTPDESKLWYCPTCKPLMS